MQFKQVFKYKDIRDKIVNAVDTLADPIRQTLSPKGANVVFEDDVGGLNVTNDGVTIAKNINVDDPVENAIINILKHSALKTNGEAGDGTTTSILLSQILVKEGLKLVDDGENPIMVKKALDGFGELLVDTIKSKAVKIKNDKELENVARISANNDKEIAKDVVRVVKTAGTDGMVFIEPNKKNATEIIEDSGFIVKGGMYSPDLRNSPTKFNASYDKPHVFITDKRIYYHEEAETILRVAIENNARAVVVIARDFIGQAVNTFIANHTAGNINVLLVKDPSATEKGSERLDDLAIYLGGKVITDKRGSLVNKITIDDFVVARKVYSDSAKTILMTNDKTNPDLSLRIQTIRKELDKDSDNQEMKERLAALTNGMVTIKVGGSTPIEVNEKIYRYDDAVNATRAAMRDGYLVGGGVSIFRAYQQIKDKCPYPGVFKKFCEANLRQIAENCGKHSDSLVEEIASNESWNYGYNALTDKYEDLLKAGVVDPYKVTEMSILNSISVTGVIISSKYLIVNKKEDESKSEQSK